MIIDFILHPLSDEAVAIEESGAWQKRQDFGSTDFNFKNGFWLIYNT